MKPRRQIRADPPPSSALRRYRPVSTAPSVPVPVGLAIAGGLLVLGLIVVLIGSGLVVGVAKGFGDAFQNAVTRLTSQPPSTAAPSGATFATPRLDAPEPPGYTSQPTLALQGSVPSDTVGRTGYSVKVYQLIAGKSTAKTLVAEVLIGATTRFTTSPLNLVEGNNTFAATLDGPTGEGAMSPAVTYMLDTAAPQVAITAPRQNAYVNSGTVTVAGQTDPGISIVVRNRQVAGGGAATTTSGPDGKWTAAVRIVAGANTVVVSATDLAGNSASTTLTVHRDYGNLAAHLQVTPSKFAASAPKTTLKLVLHATSVNGGPLIDAQVRFMVLVQGLGPIQSPQLTTDGGGTATWQIDIAGATPGTGNASVLVTDAEGDTVTADAPITIT